jgi:hypothetical protein
MSDAPGSTLPTVVMSSVVRSSHRGESHGGVYLVDLQRETIRQTVDWNAADIDWEGRGGDRGLRGIAFHGDRVLLAASDEVFVYDRSFQPIGSFTNPYLKHCHEIVVYGGHLYLSSTGFDSILEYDLEGQRFTRGFMLRFSDVWRGRRRLRLRPRPSFRVYDPNDQHGPGPGDTSHINNVFVDDQGIYASGVGLGTLWRIGPGARLERYASIPYGTHNATPYRGGVLLNHTATDRVALVSRKGKVLRSYPVPVHDRSDLTHTDLTSDKARQAFGRGLAVVDERTFVAGSSPATVTVYRTDPPAIVKHVVVSNDLRNAVHGLEVWPFDASTD